MSPGLLQDFLDRYTKYEDSIKYIIVVIAEAYYSGGYQFDAREKPIFDFRITKFVFRSSDDLNFVILVEDSNTGDPSSITVRMEYLFVFQFSYCGKSMRERQATLFLLIFVLWRCFDCRRVRIEAESLIWGQLKSSLSVFLANLLG